MSNLLNNLKKAFDWFIDARTKNIENYLAKSSDIYELEYRQKMINYNSNSNRWF